MIKITTNKNGITNNHYSTQPDKIIKSLESDGFKITGQRKATVSEMKSLYEVVNQPQKPRIKCDFYRWDR